MWAKVLHYMRTFQDTSYLVRSLSEIVKDMWVFLIILAIVVVGFGEAF